MSSGESMGVDRRGFLQTGAAAAAAASLASGGLAVAAAAPAPQTLPRRKLGNTGVEVTILELGTWQSPGLNRLLGLAYDSGVRTFDTADCYGSEEAIARWFRAKPEVRKEIFLVTKDHPRRSPRELIKMIDKRLAKLETDYVDLFLIHGIGPGSYGSASLDWPKSRELKETIETLKKSGKARFVGFSCHDALRPQYLQAAAEGGIVDAIMLQFSPWLDQDAPLNRAIDACHKRGIGLISMKHISGNADLAGIAQRVPNLIAKGFTPYQGLLHAIWTDERITTSCVSMRNTDQIREDVAAALKFEPMKQAEIQELRDACLAARPTFCADCDGRCARAAGTAAPLGDLARFLTYHDHYGYRAEARRLYSELPEPSKDWAGANLAAAQEACPSRLDFVSILERLKDRMA